MECHSSLQTDLYELTMAAGYFRHRREATATFELYCHTMPESRAYLVVCGLAQIVDYILNLRFQAEDIAYLKTLDPFRHVDPAFFAYLWRLRFSGDVWAMPEGEVAFANEPLVQVRAPIIEAQILETYLLSMMNISCSVASKASRVTQAARYDGKERSVVDFGSRRAHGPEAGLLAARAARIGGCAGTSNVEAGRLFGIPVYGTMAHAWVEAFDSETDAFAAYRQTFPDHTILLVDTYNSLEGVRRALRLDQPFNGIRLDSGNLRHLSLRARAILDEHGRSDVKILASGNLNEYKIRELVQSGAPIDGFGVGTEMVVSRDTPALDLTYKLMQVEESDGEVKYRAKFSQGKKTMPGRKQVYRQMNREGRMTGDTIALDDEPAPARSRPLLEPVVRNGRLVRNLPDVKTVRRQAQDNLTQLTRNFFHLKRRASYPVKYSAKLTRVHRGMSPPPQ